tara:strand:- start:12755 stop:12928 length:174 start_codon:yes stop_codon:yes gene_type:complete
VISQAGELTNLLGVEVLRRTVPHQDLFSFSTQTSAWTVFDTRQAGAFRVAQSKTATD